MADNKHYLEKELEELVQSDPDIWRFIQEGSLDGVWYWDLENPEHEYMSPEMWRVLGYDPATKEHKVDEWQDLIFPEDLETAVHNLTLHLEDHAHPYDQIARYKNGKGGTTWVRCRGVAVRDETGKPIRLIGAHNDITAYKNSEQELQVARDELEAIFNATPNGKIAFDESGSIVRINKRGREFLGVEQAETPFAWPENLQFYDTVTMHPLEPSKDPLTRATGGEQLEAEIHLLQTGAHKMDQRYVCLDSALVQNENSNIHFVLVVDDVTQAERNRQAIERKSRLDALGQLTGGIAHDFNNLLASQLYALDLAKNSHELQRRDIYLDVARKSIERGRELTSRLLSFARKQPGLATARQTKPVLEDFLKLVRPMIEAHIEIVLNVEDNQLMHFCDQVQLETALMNMVLNSRDAILRSEKGNRIEVSARAVRSTSQDLESRQVKLPDLIEHETITGKSFRYVEISVADNGPGMDEETLKRCTDPFFSTKDNMKDTGLGLSMVYGFLRQANGDLRIYSEIGVGTTVQFTLPRGTNSDQREGMIEDDHLALGSGQTVLLVDDEIPLLTMMSAVIENMGYTVVTAKSGQEAVEKSRVLDKVDLLLTDVVMPGEMNGFELAQRLRQNRPDLPVIYASGYTGFTSEEMGEVQAPLLQKPADPKVLAKTINSALS